MLPNVFLMSRVIPMLRRDFLLHRPCRRRRWPRRRAGGAEGTSNFPKNSSRASSASATPRRTRSTWSRRNSRFTGRSPRARRSAMPWASGAKGCTSRACSYVGAKKEWPSWTPTQEMIDRNPGRLQAKWEDGMPGGPGNPLGSRARSTFSRPSGGTPSCASTARPSRRQSDRGCRTAACALSTATSRIFTTRCRCRRESYFTTSERRARARSRPSSSIGASCECWARPPVRPAGVRVAISRQVRSQRASCAQTATIGRFRAVNVAGTHSSHLPARKAGTGQKCSAIG